MDKLRYEQRSALNAIETYLTAQGITGATYTDGYQPDTTIAPPHITVHIPPSGPRQLQMGRVQGQNSLFARTLVINAYMENEGRAQSMIDHIMNFMEFICIEVKDHEDVLLGTFQCADYDGILGQVFPPIMGAPKNLRWRAAVTAPFESFYPNA